MELASKRCGDLGKEVRQISHQLYPPALDLLGLAAALDEVLTPYRTASIEASITSHQEVRTVRLPQDTEVALYRIAQEAINNAVRHGKAKKIDIELRSVGEEFVLSVTDNGSGFDVAKKGLGLGMTSMKSRITGVGGKLSFDFRAWPDMCYSISGFAQAQGRAGPQRRQSAAGDGRGVTASPGPASPASASRAGTARVLVGVLRTAGRVQVTTIAQVPGPGVLLPFRPA